MIHLFFYSRRHLLNRTVLLISLLFIGSAFAQTRTRTEIRIPDILGYRTLKCDFHMHTVFSDGTVWPHIRVEEAWREGLDAISITDHIEYQPHKEDVKADHNRSFQLARGHAEALDLLLIPGGEITRRIPPGHLNVIFVQDVNILDKKDWYKAISAGVEQGGFCFFNHPGWYHSDNVSRWYEEHDRLLQDSLLHGVEVVNTRDYYPVAHQWCLDKNLTMIGTSDIHNPINLDYELHRGDHRPVTLVFAEERTPESIRDALFKRRTAVYSAGLLIGREEYLKAIFRTSIQIRVPGRAIRGKGSILLQIQNTSDIPYHLVLEEENEFISTPAKIVLSADKTVLFRVRSKADNLSGKKDFSLVYRIANLLATPETGLRVTIPVRVEFVPES
jgi:hypothetical protein